MSLARVCVRVSARVSRALRALSSTPTTGISNTSVTTSSSASSSSSSSSASPITFAVADAPPSASAAATLASDAMPAATVDERGVGMSLTPRQVVAELDKHIVGQADAKRAVAIALRNRYRRHKLADGMRAEVSPKNILMVGPTGVGKTEIARRLAKLCDAPFVKVEATKYTEVGFHGKDVDEMIKDLVDASLRLLKQRRRALLRKQVAPAVETRLVDLLVGDAASDSTKAEMLRYLRAGGLEHVMVRVPVPVGGARGGSNDDDELDGVGGLAGGLGNLARRGTGVIAIPASVVAGMRGGNFVSQLLAGAQGKKGGAGGGDEKIEHLPVSKARDVLTDIEVDKQLGNEDLTREAIRLAENDGIVVIDEIDKVCSPKGARDGKDASAEGVQRDLLPLVEGSVVSTKYGNVDTTHILFIASGAFSACKPADMLPELQGRLPIRVELKPLTEADLQRILLEPEYNLLAQQRALLATERLRVEFDADAVAEIARVAAGVNAAAENIGARRLHAVVEKLMEELSFEAPERTPDSHILIDREFVRARVASMIKSADLSRYVL